MADPQAQSEQSQTGASRSRDDGQEQRLGAVFWVTVAISVAFVLWGILFTDNFTSTTGTIVGWITEGLGWLYMLITTFFLVFVIYRGCCTRTYRSRSGTVLRGQNAASAGPEMP